MPADKRPPKVPANAAKASLLENLNPEAAGIDVGAEQMWVAVPVASVPATPSQPAATLPPDVRCFGTFTADLQAIVAWLRDCPVDTVALESTGVYWIPL